MEKTYIYIPNNFLNIQNITYFKSFKLSSIILPIIYFIFLIYGISEKKL